MGSPTTLIDTTFSGKDITTAISVYEYTADGDYTIRIQVRLAAVAGNGDYVIWATLNDGDAQTDDRMGEKSTVALEAGETAVWFPTIPIDVKSGDVVNIFILGLAGDNNESGSIRIFSDNYSTASALATVDGKADVIQERTDNLPDDPADASVVAGLIGGLNDAPDLTVEVADLPTNAELASALLALQGADSDTLETLSDQLDLVEAMDVIPASATGAAVVSGTISVYRHSTITFTLSDLGTLTGFTKLWFTAKDNPESDDSDSYIQVEESVGLVVINKTAATPADGSLTVDDDVDGDITVEIDESVASLLPTINSLYYDVKILNGGDVTILATGTMNILAPVTKAVS